ncbi:unnamed protein product [Clavelina lepadiformis]|uniref:Uncharacterized protein n=1 Tax=Clavelina lepadiformis TaxID=159417 RepID=A0ABP0G6D9_CLALP
MRMLHVNSSPEYIMRCTVQGITSSGIFCRQVVNAGNSVNIFDVYPGGSVPTKKRVKLGLAFPSRKLPCVGPNSTSFAVLVKGLIEN